MPTVIFDGPFIKDIDKKRDLAKEVTEVAMKICGVSRESIVVVIKEGPLENVGVAGQLVIDRENAGD